MKRGKNLLKTRQAALVLTSIILFTGDAFGQVSNQAPESFEEASSVIQQATKIDEWPNIRFNDEKARLDNAAIRMRDSPSNQLYMIGYGGSTCRPGKALGRVNRARAYLVSSRGAVLEQIITVDGGNRRVESTEVYLLPLGATRPPATPTLRPCRKPQPRTRR